MPPTPPLSDKASLTPRQEVRASINRKISAADATSIASARTRAKSQYDVRQQYLVSLTDKEEFVCLDKVSSSAASPSLRRTAESEFCLSMLGCQQLSDALNTPPTMESKTTAMTWPVVPTRKSSSCVFVDHRTPKLPALLQEELSHRHRPLGLRPRISERKLFEEEESFNRPSLIC